MLVCTCIHNYFITCLFMYFLCNCDIYSLWE